VFRKALNGVIHSKPLMVNHAGGHWKTLWSSFIHKRQKMFLHIIRNRWGTTAPRHTLGVRALLIGNKQTVLLILPFVYKGPRDIMLFGNSRDVVAISTWNGFKYIKLLSKCILSAMWSLETFGAGKDKSWHGCSLFPM